ncbi:RNA-directed DNA polymerase, eukaryota [Tanacetum coccineum]
MVTRAVAKPRRKWRSHSPPYPPLLYDKPDPFHVGIWMQSLQYSREICFVFLIGLMRNFDMQNCSVNIRSYVDSDSGGDIKAPIVRQWRCVGCEFRVWMFIVGDFLEKKLVFGISGSIGFKKVVKDPSWGYIIINGSSTVEFQFFKGLKQGDPLSPFLFILIMESLHLSFQRVVDAGMFKGLHLSPLVNLSHMFYTDDAVFVGQWCDDNIILLFMFWECFFVASGLLINMYKEDYGG